jgi:DNA polymerase-1
MSYVTWDVETTIRSSFKRKGNPFDPLNHVVMSGYKREGGKVQSDYFGRTPPTGDWFTKLLDGTDILVGQNIKFDLLYALRDKPNHDAWMPWVAAGGLVWDIQLAEYLLNGMDPEDHMLSLDELAVRYGGNVKFDEVKAMWADGIDTTDIPRDLLTKYLVGTDTDHGDIGNTELVYLGQLQRATACGQLRSIYMNMGSLLCTIEMELNGMAVDKELGLKQAEELASEVATLSVELSSHLPRDLPFDFNWNSSRQKSAIIFGGTVPYQARMPVLDDRGQQAYAMKDERQAVLEDGSTMELNWWEHLYYTEWGGEVPEGKDLARFKAGKNAGEVKTKIVKVKDLSKPKSRMEDFLYEFPRLIEPKAKWAGATDGVYSTSADVIDELGGKGVPFLDLLVKFTSLTKDLTTYYITTEDGRAEGYANAGTGVWHYPPHAQPYVHSDGPV